MVFPSNNTIAKVEMINCSLLLPDKNNPSTDAVPLDQEWIL